MTGNQVFMESKRRNSPVQSRCKAMVGVEVAKPPKMNSIKHFDSHFSPRNSYFSHLHFHSVYYVNILNYSTKLSF